MTEADLAEALTQRAFASFASDATLLVRPPGVAAARRRAAVRRRNRRASGSVLAVLIVLAGFGVYLLGAGRNGPSQTVPPADPPAPGVYTNTPSPIESAGVVTTAPTDATPRTGVAVPYDPRLIPAGSRGSGERLVRPAEDDPVHDGSGTFRSVCRYSHMRPEDPAKAGLTGGSPLYMYWGNTGATSRTSGGNLTGSGNSTCRGGVVDRSAYFAPALIDTRTHAPVAPADINVHYGAGRAGLDPGLIRPLPAGLRMRAGDPGATGSQGGDAQWSCYDEYTGGSATIPTSCPGGRVEMRIYFPQCWDGSHLDTTDQRHLAYPDEATARCPSSNPVPLPEVSYFVRYDVGQFPGAYRLATDVYPAPKAGGQTVHAFWANGWDQNIHQTWVTFCVNRRVSCRAHLLGDGRELDGPV